MSVSFFLTFPDIPEIKHKLKVLTKSMRFYKILYIFMIKSFTLSPMS